MRPPANQSERALNIVLPFTIGLLLSSAVASDLGATDLAWALCFPLPPLTILLYWLHFRR